eukprot:COSAG02_NODE_30825_length_544_cov_3.211236_1_plen_128_part_10
MAVALKIGRPPCRRTLEGLSRHRERALRWPISAHRTARPHLAQTHGKGDFSTNLHMQAATRRVADQRGASRLRILQVISASNLTRTPPPCERDVVTELCVLRTFGGVDFSLIFICAQSVPEFLWDRLR